MKSMTRVLLLACLTGWVLAGCATNARVDRVEAQVQTNVTTLDGLKAELAQNETSRQQVKGEIRDLKRQGGDHEEKIKSLEENLTQLNAERSTIQTSLSALQGGVEHDRATQREQEKRRAQIVRDCNKRWKKIDKQTAEKVKKLDQERAVTDHDRL